jgi:Short C-terminal domain
MRRQTLFSQDPFYGSEEYANYSQPANESYVLFAGEGGSPPVKLSQYDVQRIEEHTGNHPADLEDYELRQSMSELNIHSAPLTDHDYSALGMQEVGETVVRRRPTPTVSLEDQLTGLSDLKQKGLITEDDYQSKKKQILGI